MHITRGSSVARPLAGIITGCCQDYATSPPPCEAVQVKAAPLRISRAAAAATAAGEASAARAATATSLGAARQTQHQQHDERCRQRRPHHHHLRIMPPNARRGCPVPPRPAHSSPASHSFPRSTSLPLWKLAPATHSPPFTPSFPSSPVSAAAPASSPPSSLSASAKESSSSANPIHNQHSNLHFVSLSEAPPSSTSQLFSLLPHLLVPTLTFLLFHIPPSCLH
ncbi:unnamed protein product [Closterium sp. Naga37s-1]|nr:unnamed protein product [Closterium sp. Naga37s-1]